MENEIINTAAIPEAHEKGPINIQFTEQTTGQIYTYTIDSIQTAISTIIALGSTELAREGELKLLDFVAQLKNAQRRFSQAALERATFEELNAAQPNTVAESWTIVDGKRVTLSQLEGGR